jgi:oxygen-independent coproporphyrinogen-3 oxidase
MTSLRTKEGLDLDKLEKYNSTQILSTAERFINSGTMILKGTSLILTKEGKLLADGIAAELFF